MESLAKYLSPIYKRTYDGYYIFNNALNIANVLGWNSIDEFVYYIKDEFINKNPSLQHIDISQYNNIILIPDAISITELNEFFIQEFKKDKNQKMGAGIS